MTFNKETSIGLINKTLYCKEFYEKIQKLRIITSAVMIACIFIALGLLISCSLITHDTVWTILISVAFGLVCFQIIYSLCAAFFNSNRIKKFVLDRYNKWILKYYLICSDNFSNFSMSETEKPNEFLCSVGNAQFVLIIENKYIQITKENDKNQIKINNEELHLFHHKINLNDTKMFYVKKDLYFECNRIVSNLVATYIEQDIRYILEKTYGTY